MYVIVVLCLCTFQAKHNLVGHDIMSEHKLHVQPEYDDS